MVVELPRRWRWVIGSGCVIVLALMTLLIAAEQAVEPGPPAPGTARSFAAAPGSESIAPPAEVPAPDAGPPSRGADEIEVCGGGWVKLPDAQNASPEQMEFARAEFERATRLPQRRADVLAALRAAPDELATATARLLELTLASDAGDDAGAMNAREALMRIALSTRNPKVYALAFKVCGGGVRQEGSCAMVSAEQWARLDPDNATPWLFILGNGKTPLSAGARDEALHRIATAARSDVYFHAAAGALIDAAPAGEKPLLAVHELVGRVMGVEAAVALPGYQTLIAACRGDALKDANRAQACDSVAELLSERSATLMDRLMGVAMGRRLGWPTDRTDRLRGEYEAYLATRVDQTQIESAASCVKIERELDDVRLKARLGETGALRAWVAASGKQPEDFIRDQRARESSREAAAAQYMRAAAASAAPALSPATQAPPR